MKRFNVFAIVLISLAAGCASPDVNPTRAKPGTGYVDFYADDDAGLCWQIGQLGKDPGHGKPLVGEFRARTNEIVRVAFPPGEYRFTLSFLNRVIEKPAKVTVDVIEGKITPVRLILDETGKTLIESRETRMGASYTRTGRTTKVRATEGATFGIRAEVGESIPYARKERILLSGIGK